MGDNDSSEVVAIPVRRDSLNLLSVPPVCLKFSDVTFDVQITSAEEGIISKLNDKVVKARKSGNGFCRGLYTESSGFSKRLLHLDGFVGEAAPGDLVALMGSSGAGKSTLLNVLSRRITKNAGSVRYNDGCDPEHDGGVFKDVSAFIQQEDIFYGKLTAEEHLKFQALLRLPGSTTKTQRNEITTSMLSRMGLTKARHNRIGNISQGDNAGISGGERKRLSMASELLTSPSVLFADEPTTGLDSFMAMSVVNIFKELADNGRTILCTIHQPSSRVFEQFNKMLLLCEGRLVYFGERAGAIEWFRRLGQICPPYANPADFFIRCISFRHCDRDEKLKEIDGWAEKWKTEGNDFLESWQSHGLREFTRDSIMLAKLASAYSLKASEEDALDELLLLTKDDTSTPSKSAMTDQPSEKSPSQLEMPLVLKTRQGVVRKDRLNLFREAFAQYDRARICVGRTPSMTIVRLAQTIILSLVPSLMFFQLQYSRPDCQNRVAACFLIMLNQCLVSVVNVSMTFPLERPIFQREYEGGITRTAAYFLGRVASEQWVFFLFPLIFHTICFFTMHLAESALKWFLSYLVLVLVVQATVSYGYIISSLFSSIETIMITTQVVTMMFSLFSGFLAKSEDLGKFWIWLIYMDPFYYGLRCYSLILFQDINLSPTFTGYDFLDDVYGITPKGFYAYIGALLAITIGGRLLAYAILEFKARRSKQNQ
eukprot:GHVS01086420.1.p1 GENE.GHVS01086420.1~~GHVS01086420.1.p1  ORF type:complete len:711 (+),score=80.29 GHVS01086420.1:206-2338(+)